MEAVFTCTTCPMGGWGWRWGWRWGGGGVGGGWRGCGWWSGIILFITLNFF